MVLPSPSVSRSKKRGLKIPGGVNKKRSILKYKASTSAYGLLGGTLLLLLSSSSLQESSHECVKGRICSGANGISSSSSSSSSNRDNGHGKLHTEGVYSPFININRKMLAKKSRVKYLRYLRKRVYSYFKLIHNVYFNLAGKKKKKKNSIFNKNGGNFFHIFYRNFFIKTLNIIKIKSKISEIVRRKNEIYKKVVAKIKERSGVPKRKHRMEEQKVHKTRGKKEGELKNYEKYHKTVLDLLAIIKNQDKTITNNMINMLSNINEYLNQFYANICHCIPSENSEKRDVVNAMNQKIESLKEDIHFIFPYERNIFRTNRNNYFNDSDSWETQGRLYIGNEHTSSNVNTLNISCD
ncbi:hypothetical protein PMLGA01_120031300, partial [Plasmodium malariae]